MLIIPMTGKISWRNPPVLTILLILANIFVYFMIQSGDEEKYLKAQDYYRESGLAEMEISKYVEYLKAGQRGEEASLPAGVKMGDPSAMAYLHHKMVNDREFAKKLNNGDIIRPEDPLYPKWKDSKKEYEHILAETVAQKYGYKPGNVSYTTAFTYMFLHGSVMHLMGNMVFLWLVGCTLELAGRRPAYVLIYLLTGILSAVGFGMIYRGSTVPLVGASGAISGIIGAYTALFGRSKVRIFYSLGFYFNYARVSAIYLLPVWIGNEIFQLYFGGMSSVAYAAHIGGLVSGAALGLAQVKLLGGVPREAMQEDRAEKIASWMEAGLQKLSELDLQGARELMSRILGLDPENLGAQTHLFNIEKLSPEREEFHEAAAKLLLSLYREPDSQETLLTTYQEYCRIARPPKLSPDLWSRLCSSFSQHDRMDEAAKIMALLLRTNPGFPAVPTALLNLSRGYLKAGMRDKGLKCLRLLCLRYPQSTECEIAEGLMKRAA